MAVRAHQASEAPGRALLENRQLGQLVITQLLDAPTGPGGNDFDVNVGKATHPAGEPAVDLPDSGVPKPAFSHCLAHDDVIAWVVVEDNGDDPHARRRRCRWHE